MLSNILKLLVGDVKVVVISYILMTFYIMLMLGKVTSTSKKWYSCDIGNYIAQKKFILSIFGVLLVLLSVAASIGLFGLIGIPSTIVSFQVLPFLVSTEWNELPMLRDNELPWYKNNHTKIYHLFLGTRSWRRQHIHLSRVVPEFHKTWKWITNNSFRSSGWWGHSFHVYVNCSSSNSDC